MDRDLESCLTHSATPGGAVEAPSAEFDEAQFLPAAADREKYCAEVARGYNCMQSQRAIIAGLARNIETILPVTIARIERIGGLLRDYRVVIYENDSSDRTLDLLHAWGNANPRVSIVSERRSDPVNLPNRSLSRAARMAYYRSQCQRLIKRDLAQFDSVIIVDTDLEGGYSYDGIAHTYSQDGWDFVGANGIIYRRQGLRPNAIAQYDAWAFRIDEELSPLTTKEVNRMLYRRGQPLQPVTSCFGGIGIYRMPAYLAGRYEGSDVEHVTFHREMRRQGFGRIYLNPNLIAVYGRKHRSFDRWAARTIRLLDLLPIRRETTWNFPAIDNRAA